MNTDFSIKTLDVHLWRTFLPQHAHQIERFLLTLSPDELKRAERFRFAQHRERFILARGLLREILHLYTGLAAEKIEFVYGPQGKPYLANNLLNLFFNVSHSHDMAVYGFTIGKEIGIDIEKIELHFKEDIAKRFFSQVEFNYLLSLPESKRHIEFYAIWARKEALIKALGKGLYTPLESFSVLSDHTVAIEEQSFHLENFIAHPDYQAAFAVQAPIASVCYWEWVDGRPHVQQHRGSSK
jgi:4'-phosphopantetheinyl transferase